MGSTYVEARNKGEEFFKLRCDVDELEAAPDTDCTENRVSVDVCCRTMSLDAIESAVEVPKDCFLRVNP